MIRGLYIGRFQPYHNGHEKILRSIENDIDELIIGIGSSEKSHTFNNPFTGGERIEMIKRATETLDKVKYIIPYSDIEYNSLWVSYIKSISPKFDIVYSNNPLVTRLFIENKISVKNTEMYEREFLRGTKIRQLMYSKSEKWKNYVPINVINLILETDILNRMESLKKNDK